MVFIIQRVFYSKIHSIRKFVLNYEQNNATREVENMLGAVTKNWSVYIDTHWQRIHTQYLEIYRRIYRNQKNRLGWSKEL